MSQFIETLTTDQSDFAQRFAEKTAWQEAREREVEQRVSAIVEQVAKQGDEALVALTARLDRRAVNRFEQLVIEPLQMTEARASLAKDQLWALETAAERVEDYHRRQSQESWSYRDEMGNLLGQKITPLEKAGVYVPGGKAAYPSSVLMNVIPAKVAGVSEVIMVTPTPDDLINPMVLAAASIAGVDRAFSIGGAQAIAALALGTQSVPKVDKIVGPGNAYVAAAKRQLFGRVGIDMIAGPSEILVIADGSVPSEWVAMDLLSQAEHDEEAQAILLCDSAEYLAQVKQSLATLLPTLERTHVARTSLENRGLLVLCKDLNQAMQLSNQLAPEHLELAVTNAEAMLSSVVNAGAVFLGSYSPEAVGDYCAGPNHVLPTSATARFSSPLGVYDFQKRTSIIGCSAKGGSELGKIASVLARGESLTAHARSAEYRIID